MIEYGIEADTLRDVPDAIRWWIYINVKARNQRARRGVVDHGFRFARGGRAASEAEAAAALAKAKDEAEYELSKWKHQPSHMLGPGGQLIPLG